MRAASSAETTAVTTGILAVWVRVRVDSNGAGNFVDLGTMDGKDWVQEVSWSDSVDDPMARATVTLSRAMSYSSLSPYMTGSKYNAGQAYVAVNRRIYIDTCVTVPDASRPTTGWRNQFYGRIDEIEPGRQGMVLTCRDIGCDLADAWVTSSVNYVASGERTITAVLNNILTDFSPSVTSVSGTGPTYTIKTMANGLDKTSVLDALRRIAEPTGFQVRYRYTPGGGDLYELQYWNPPRTSTTSLQTFPATWYLAIDSAKISRINIRNKIVVNYVPKTSATDANTTVTKSTYQDTASQTAYGVRYMEITEDASSQISTQTECDTFGNSMLMDLALPVMEQTVTMPYWGPTELGDVYTFGANYEVYDTDQVLAVTSFTHTINRDGAVTEMGLRGKPAGAYRNWLRMAAAPGVAPGISMDPGLPPLSLTANPGQGSITLDYTIPAQYDGARWAYSELYWKVNDGNVFTQASAGTPVVYARPATTGNAVLGPAKGRVTRFVVPDLTPGTTYRFVVVMVTVNGVVSPISNQVTAAPYKTGSTWEDLSSAGIGILPNGDFNTYSRGTAFPPDSWTPVLKGTSTPAPAAWAGTTRTAGCYSRIQSAQTGIYSLAFSQTQANAGGSVPANYPDLLSDWITVQGDGNSTTSTTPSAGVFRETLNVGQYDVNASYFPNWALTFEVFDATKTTLISTLASISIATTNPATTGIPVWTVSSVYNGLPAAARYVRARLSPALATGGTPTGSTLVTWLVDRILLYRALGRFARTNTTSTAGFSGTMALSTYVPLPLGTKFLPANGEDERGFDMTQISSNPPATAACQAAGTYNVDATAIMAVGSGGASASWSLALVVAGTTTYATPFLNSDGVQQQTITARGIYLNAQDAVGLRFLISTAAQRNNTWSVARLIVSPSNPQEI